MLDDMVLLGYSEPTLRGVEAQLTFDTDKRKRNDP